MEAADADANNIKQVTIAGNQCAVMHDESYISAVLELCNAVLADKLAACAL